MQLISITNKIRKVDLLIPDLRAKPSWLVIVFGICFSFWLVDLWRPFNQANGEHNFHGIIFDQYSYLQDRFCTAKACKNLVSSADKLPIGPLGKPAPRSTYGISLLYSPFFGIAYLSAYIQNIPLSGLSEPFVTWMHLSGIFYVFLGLVLLRSFLLNWYSEKVVAFTLATLLFGSMLFYYTYVQSELAQSYLFFLFSLFLWLTNKWYQNITWGRSIGLAVVFGIIVLIHPPDLILVFIFLFWNIKKIGELKQKFLFLRLQYKYLAVMLFFTLVWWSLQLIINKLEIGTFLFYNQTHPNYFWNDPQILNILFSYRKGWITYSPIVAFIFVGLFFIKEQFPLKAWAILFYLGLMIYVLSCFWDWGYGNYFGPSAFCQMMVVMAIPLAQLIETVSTRASKSLKDGVMGMALVIVLCSAIFYNIGLNYHFNITKKMHANGMSKEIYWDLFRTFQFEEGYDEKWKKELKEPDLSNYAKGIGRSQ